MSMTALDSSNPVRSVLSLLNQMKQKIEKRGRVELDLYNKYMCYCKSNSAALDASIGAAREKLPELQANLQSTTDDKEQTAQGLEKDTKEFDKANQDKASAGALQAKEGATHQETIDNLKSNITLVKKVIEIITSSHSSTTTTSFLQSTTAQRLRMMVQEAYCDEETRQVVLSFLSGDLSDDDGDEYNPRSGAILGALTQLVVQLQQELEKLTGQGSGYNALIEAKQKEITAVSVALQTKTNKVGVLGVEIAQLTSSVDKMNSTLIKDEKFAEELKTNCRKKANEWQVRKHTRLEELKAIGMTIDVLSHESNLRTFRNSKLSNSTREVEPVASSSPSFLQISKKMSKSKRALMELQRAKESSGNKARLNFITEALQNSPQGFEEVIKMIDQLGEVLAKEAQEDRDKKTDCETRIGNADVLKTGLKGKVEEAQQDAEDFKANLNSASSSKVELEKQIKDLDNSTALLTEERKKENAEYVDNLAENSAAKELLQKAKTLLGEFYSRPGAASFLQLDESKQAAEDEEEEEADADEAGADDEAEEDRDTAVEEPPPAPETFGSTYEKNKNGQTALDFLSQLIVDIETEINQANHAEQTSVADYEETLEANKKRRQAKVDELTQSGSNLASSGQDLELTEEKINRNQVELNSTTDLLTSLHSSCDWLLQNFDARAEARVKEEEALKTSRTLLKELTGPASAASFLQIARRASRTLLG
eukprot:CAMPEP_0194541510 /NCGR_PEP_ID=MMETSP0253-20130528/82322_1 /TAXON_ID=2966 /ORGANISM="Noctiluca scintillans" /LENGTH=711 /DNA_ID=CAMNT_0039388001 /DNA_START=64 /DNA_END=2196 /DNA_ORIENTATION=+